MATSLPLRLVVVALTAALAYLLIRVLPHASNPSAAAPKAEVRPLRLAPEALLALPPAVRAVLAGETPPPLPDEASAGERRAFVSLSRAAQPALVAMGRGSSLTAAVADAALKLKARASAAELSAGRLKVDVPSAISTPRAFDEKGGSELEAGLDGLLLPGVDLWLLPEEIAARRLIRTNGDLQTGRLREALGGDPRLPVDQRLNVSKAGMPYVAVRFASVIEDGAGGAVELYRGNVREPELTPAALLSASRLGGEYLERHLLPDGSFGYSYRPWKDDHAQSYNLLRHAGSCYALFELYQVTGERHTLEAGEKALAWLLQHTRGPKPEHAAAGWEAIGSPGEEAKLGGTALAMLAMLKRAEVKGDRKDLPQLQRFARFLVFQQEANGHFHSKYAFGAEAAEDFESLYYPGEAILALLRLARLDGKSEWVRTAAKAADWIILERDAAKSLAELPHDHWLLIGLNELHPREKKPHYLAHAQKIAAAILGGERRDPEPLDWVGSFYDPPRSTPAATRSEALVAMIELAERNGLDTSLDRAALTRLVRFQRRCQITPENALYLPRPDHALGGFRAGLTDWEVRIDYVQHNVSSMLGLRRILGGGGG